MQLEKGYNTVFTIAGWSLTLPRKDLSLRLVLALRLRLAQYQYCPDFFRNLRIASYIPAIIWFGSMASSASPNSVCTVILSLTKSTCSTSILPPLPGWSVLAFNRETRAPGNLPFTPFTSTLASFSRPSTAEPPFCVRSRVIFKLIFMPSLPANPFADAATATPFSI